MKHWFLAIFVALAAVSTVAAQAPVELSDVAASGSGTVADPYLLDAAGWELAKGGPVHVHGVFQVAHGAMLDVPSGTEVRCESGQFRLPATVRQSDNAMFKIAADATGVLFEGCSWHPGVAWRTDAPCAHQGSNDQLGGVAYIQVGSPAESGNATFRLIDNTFHPARIVGTHGLQVKVWTGTRDALVEGNRFELSYNNIAFAAGSNVAVHTDENLTIRDNVFDGLELDATTCQDTDDSIDFEVNSIGTYKRVSINTLIQDNMFKELGPPLHWHVNGEQLRFTGNTYYGGTTHFLTMTTTDFEGLTIDGNNCMGGTLGANPGGCDIEVTGVTRRINIFGNHLDTVIDDTGLISSLLTLNGTLTDVLVHDNYLNGNRVTSTLFDCITLGSATNVQIIDNVCVDITDFVHLRNNGTNVLLQGNLLHSDAPSVPEYLFKIEPGNHSGLRAIDNHMTGFPSLKGTWTNNFPEIDYELDNTWKEDWFDASYTRVAETFDFKDVDGTTWTLDPGGSAHDIAWTNPGIGHSTSALVGDNLGGVAYAPALVVDRMATKVLAADNHTDGALPWNDPTQAYGLSLDGYAYAGRFDGAVYEQRYDFSMGPPLEWNLEVTWDTANQVGCSNECTFSVLVCTDKPCDPDIEVDRVSWTSGHRNGMRRSYHGFGLIDPSTIEVKVRWINSGSGGPPQGRTTARVYGVQLTNAPYSITMPDAVKKFIDLGPDPPPTCNVGDLWIDTDTSVDLNCVTLRNFAVCVCHQPDTWGSAN